MLELINQAKIGSIVPVYKEIDEEIDALDYFAKLSNYGNKKNSILLENNETTFGSTNPCLMVAGKDDDFEITALNALGKKFLNFIKKDFKFCDKAVYKKDKIIGKLTSARSAAVTEQQRLKAKTHLDIIRTIAFKFNPATKPFSPYCGLFGTISYDFINQIENLPANSEDLLKDPDYVFYFLDNMFVINHKTKKTYFVANALITDNNKEKIYHDCSKTINNYEKLIEKKAPKGKKYKKKKFKLSYDSSKEESLGIMKSLKKNILDGDILYASPSRLAISNHNAEPLDIYAKLKDATNSLYYINDGYGITIGSGSKAEISVEGRDEKTVELRISTTTEPRGAIQDEIENDLDGKYEALLRVDENEIAYNIMLVDAARNDVARVSESGTRHVNELFAINKQTKFQNIVFSVKGTLKKNLDALHAYLAIINPVSGFPKIKAMQLLRKTEKIRRCFSSGSIVCITPEKELRSMAIEPLRIKKDKAYIRTDSRVFHNSNDEKEFDESNKKTAKLLNAIKSAGGLK